MADSAFELCFNEERHEYSVNGRIIPSVTQIISAVGLYEFDYVSRETLAIAAERGRIVHTCVEWYEKGELDESSIDPELTGYFEAYLDCRMVNSFPAPVAIEERVYSEQYGYAGTLDQEFPDDWLNDIKTGLPSPVHGLQLSGYWLAKYGMGRKPKRLTGTYLKPGNHKLIEYPYEPLAWLSVVADYKWRLKHNLIREIWR